VLDRFQQQTDEEDSRRLYSWTREASRAAPCQSEQFFSAPTATAKFIRAWGKRDSTMDDYREARNPIRFR